MAGPRPPASRSSPCSSRPRSPPAPRRARPRRHHKGPLRPQAHPQRPPRPPPPRAAPPPTSGGVNATPKPSTTAAPPPRTPRPAPPPPAPSSTPGRSPAPPSASATPSAHLYELHPPPASAPDRARSPRAINAGAAVAPARLRSGPGAVPQVPQRHPRQPQGRPPLVERHALRRGPEGRGHVRVRALGREGRPVRARTSRAARASTGLRRRSCRGRTSRGLRPEEPRAVALHPGRGRATTQVGCALTVCAPGTIFDPKFTNTAEYYVCEYAPPGNIIGQFDQMVSV
ncbi:Fruiting body protein SC7 [Mycena indigotica]|uniref:Fruiting body protein SC7 n=1 Tax=Mycena indigotica TaxID=2126181 RepID=A0A8H6SQK3_9AGAR|nr:Fruiting body protein SC7 [Mycena indigotica]KAF7303383.1 Fruiting body protein SC7 [Mycena indigotica]